MSKLDLILLAAGKGTEVRIIGFDKERRIYKVTHLQSETQS